MSASKKSPGAKTSNAAQFETSLKQLEDIVLKLEQGELELDQSLQLFEQGMQLSQACRTALDTAELKIKNLLSDQNMEEVSS